MPTKKTGLLTLFQLVPVMLMAQARLREQSPESPLPPGGETVVGGIFFGTAKVMSVDEVRSNALSALAAKGYTVPKAASCVINITVSGSQSGCGVMFFDQGNMQMYQVRFGGTGNVLEVWGGAIRHSTIGPNDPLPKFPEGAVKVKP